MSDQASSQSHFNQYITSENEKPTYEGDWLSAHYRLNSLRFLEPETYQHSRNGNVENRSSESYQSFLNNMVPTSDHLNYINGDGQAFLRVIRLEPTALDISKSTMRSTADRVQS
ncbi:hypothetical protein F52700_4207 [Fusarium sp. NRRL 52700]|nr:hypothetical protein F52700_4207 [Fusarium sp. NRRL 52700]